MIKIIKSKYFAITLLLYSFSINSSFADNNKGYGDNSLSVYAGYNNVSNGYDNIAYGMAIVDYNITRDILLSPEIGFIDREESASSGGLSVAYDINNNFTIKTRASASTEGDVLPEYDVSLTTSYKSTPSLGLIISPTIAYREYRNGAEEFDTKLDLVKYWSSFRNNNFILSELVLVNTISNPGDENSFYVALNNNYVSPKKFSIGIGGSIGESNFRNIYDQSLESNLSFYGISNNFSLFVAKNIELLTKMEYTDAEEFEIFGGYIGTKIYF